ncbi:PilT/PilU family type 4a pilus ATPase [Candidatus Peregrinibacteria bacterium]|nr:PilT/PilU family type 4a pilus ATPase [Candidatus Peregrinibacteria bacterium]
MKTNKKMLYLKTLFEAQKKLRSSDLHLYEGHPPYLRGSDGGLYAVEKYSPLKHEDMENIMKEILSQRQIEVFLQKKDFEFSSWLEDVGRFRVNFYVEYHGMSIVFRLLSDNIESIPELGLPEAVQNLAYEHSGLVLITGPNGSGKSTTMAALLHHINETRNVNIITIENPIEVIHQPKKSVISQREVGTHVESLKDAARYLFRQDVNVVALGELSDYESISIALDLAETGHLVFATLHSDDVASTISRVINVFPPDLQNMARMKLAISLRGIVSQKLIPKQDFSGRVVAVEICLRSDEIETLILERREEKISKAMERERGLGMQTFHEHLFDLFQNGVISREQAILNAPDPEEFMNMVQEQKSPA